MANRWGIPKDVEALVKKRDLSCVYCGIQFTSLNISYKLRSTWEHIINDIRINGVENIALCCGSCNASKGAKRLEDWFKSKYCNAKSITINTLHQLLKNILKIINKNKHFFFSAFVGVITNKM